MPPVTTNLEQGDIDMIDHLADAEDVSRSALLRRAVLAWLYGTVDGEREHLLSQ